jgi:monoamine oxidase
MKVVVVGAGPAGLNAARTLAHAGIDVTVLEADGRVGGRTRTERDAFQNGQHGDMGASYIDIGQHRILELCRELEIPLTPGFAMQPDPKDGGHPGRAQILRNRLILDGRPLDEDEIEAVASEVETAMEATPATSIESMSAWSRRAGLSEPSDAAFCALAGLNPVDRAWRAPAMVWTEVPLGHLVWMFRDGTDSLARRLAEELDVRLNQPVESVGVRRDGITVHTADDTLECDEVVIAVALRGVLQIAFDPPLPEWKTSIIQGLPVSQGGKIVCQYDCADEVAAAIGTGVVTDAEIGYAWASQRSSAGTIVVTAIAADRGDGLLSRPEAAAAALDRVVHQLAGGRPVRLASAVQDWTAEPRFRGVVSMLLGRSAELVPQLAAPLERIHFAGEYTNDVWPTAMEGALRSGDRAAHEITARLG